MRMRLCGVVTGMLVLSAVGMRAQDKTAPAKTIPDSMNYMWKMVEKDFTSLAEAMPEDKWSFKPTQGAFTNARTFAEQVKHVACANQAWATQMLKQKQPERCDL